MHDFSLPKFHLRKRYTKSWPPIGSRQMWCLHFHVWVPSLCGMFT